MSCHSAFKMGRCDVSKYHEGPPSAVAALARQGRCFFIPTLRVVHTYSTGTPYRGQLITLLITLCDITADKGSYYPNIKTTLGFSPARSCKNAKAGNLMEKSEFLLYVDQHL